MRLGDVLAGGRVLVPLKAATLKMAARRLAEAAVAAPAADGARLPAVLEEALPGDVVAVGPAFLMHVRTDAVSDLVVVLGVAPKPLQKGRDATKAARIVLLVVAPSHEVARYLRLLSGFAKALGNPEIVARLLAARSPAEVLQDAGLSALELPSHVVVRDVMERDSISVGPETTLGEASRLMAGRGVHGVPVVAESGEVLGMVTHRELLRHLLPVYVKRMSSGAHRAPDAGAPDDPHQLPVREVMDRSILCVSEEQSIADVASMMINRGIERFPVVREGELVGFLTRGDIVRRLLVS